MQRHQPSITAADKTHQSHKWALNEHYNLYHPNRLQYLEQLNINIVSSESINNTFQLLQQSCKMTENPVEPFASTVTEDEGRVLVFCGVKWLSQASSWSLGRVPSCFTVPLRELWLRARPLRLCELADKIYINDKTSRNEWVNEESLWMYQMRP